MNDIESKIKEIQALIENKQFDEAENKVNVLIDDVEKSNSLHDDEFDFQNELEYLFYCESSGKDFKWNRNYLSDLYSTKADIYLKRGNYSEAVKLQNSALKFDPISRISYASILDCYVELGDEQEFLKVFKKALSVALSPVKIFDIYNKYVYLLNNTKQYSKLTNVVNYACLFFNDERSKKGIDSFSQRMGFTPEISVGLLEYIKENDLEYHVNTFLVPTYFKYIERLKKRLNGTEKDDLDILTEILYSYSIIYFFDCSDVTHSLLINANYEYSQKLQEINNANNTVQSTSTQETVSTQTKADIQKVTSTQSTTTSQEAVNAQTQPTTQSSTTSQEAGNVQTQPTTQSSTTSQEVGNVQTQPTTQSSTFSQEKAAPSTTTNLASNNSSENTKRLDEATISAIKKEITSLIKSGNFDEAEKKIDDIIEDLKAQYDIPFEQPLVFYERLEADLYSKLNDGKKEYSEKIYSLGFFYFAKGSIYYNRKNYEETIKLENMALEWNPAYYLPYVELMRCYRELNDEEGFLKVFKKAISLALLPDIVASYYEDYARLLINLKQYEKAYQVLTYSYLIYYREESSRDLDYLCSIMHAPLKKSPDLATINFIRQNDLEFKCNPMILQIYAEEGKRYGELQSDDNVENIKAQMAMYGDLYRFKCTEENHKKLIDSLRKYSELTATTTTAETK